MKELKLWLKDLCLVIGNERMVDGLALLFLSFFPIIEMLKGGIIINNSLAL